jgi:hypothetical protein
MLKLHDLEHLLLQAESDYQRANTRSPFSDITDFLDEHLLVGAALKAAALGGMDLIEPQLYPERRFFLIGAYLALTDFFMQKYIRTDSVKPPVSNARKAINLLFQYPIVPAALTTAVAVLIKYGLSYILNDLDQDSLILLTKTTAKNYAIWSITSKFPEFSREMFAHFGWMNSMGSHLRTAAWLSRIFYGPNPGATAKLKAAATCYKASLSKIFAVKAARNLLYCQLLLGEADEALGTLFALVEQNQFDRVPWHMDTNIPKRAELLRTRKLYGLHTYGSGDELVYQISQIYHDMIENSELLPAALDALVTAFPDEPLMLALRGKFLQGQGDYAGAADDFARVLDELERKNALYSESESPGQSRRATWCLTAPQARHSLFFQEATEQQAIMAQIVADIFGERVVQPVAYLDEKDVMVLQREQSRFGWNLFDQRMHLSRAEMYTAIISALEFVGDYQAAQPDISARLEEHEVFLVDAALDNPFYYKDRLLNVFVAQSLEHGIKLPQDLVACLEEDSAQVNAVACRLPRRIYWDSNWKNIIRLINRAIKAADFENPIIKARYIDVVTAVEFFDYFNDQEIASLYYLFYAGLDDHPPMQEYTMGIHTCGLIRHLELFGYRARDAAKAEDDELFVNRYAQNYHLQRAEYHARSLSTHACLSSAEQDAFARTSENLLQFSEEFACTYETDLESYEKLRKELAAEAYRDTWIIGRLSALDPEIKKMIALDIATFIPMAYIAIKKLLPWITEVVP